MEKTGFIRVTTNKRRGLEGIRDGYKRAFKVLTAATEFSKLNDLLRASFVYHKMPATFLAFHGAVAVAEFPPFIFASSSIVSRIIRVYVHKQTPRTEPKVDSSTNTNAHA